MMCMCARINYLMQDNEKDVRKDLQRPHNSDRCIRWEQRADRSSQVESFFAGLNGLVSSAPLFTANRISPSQVGIVFFTANRSSQVESFFAGLKHLVSSAPLFTAILFLAGRNRVSSSQVGIVVFFKANRSSQVETFMFRRSELCSLERSPLHGDSLPRRSESSLFLAGRNRHLLQGETFFAGRITLRRSECFSLERNPLHSKSLPRRSESSPVTDIASYRLEKQENMKSRAQRSKVPASSRQTHKCYMC